MRASPKAPTCKMRNVVKRNFYTMFNGVEELLECGHARHFTKKEYVPAKRRRCYSCPLKPIDRAGLSEKMIDALKHIGARPGLSIGNYRLQEPHTYVARNTFNALHDRGLVQQGCRNTDIPVAYLSDKGRKLLGLDRKIEIS